MADEKFDSLTLVGRHVPDVSIELGPDGNKVAEPLPGTYEVGVQLGGRFVVLQSVKAGNLVDDDNKVQVSDSAKGSRSSDESTDVNGEAITTLSERLHEIEQKLAGHDDSQSDESNVPNAAE